MGRWPWRCSSAACSATPPAIASWSSAERAAGGLLLQMCHPPQQTPASGAVAQQRPARPYFGAREAQEARPMTKLDATRPATRRIAVLVFPSFPMMAFSAVIEPLRAANVISARKLYDWIIVGPDDGLV